MNLAVFDVDGTLLDNLAAEDACFCEALREGLGLPTPSSDWESYEHVSDHAIAVEAYRRHFGASPSHDAIASTIERFVDLLARAHGAEPMAAVQGAEELLAGLPRHGWAIALATGAWRRAAEFKLGAGGLYDATLPIATAEDGPARTAIVRTAVARAEQHHHTTFARIVSIGDGVWDVHTARTLRLPFVGVARGAGAERLRAAGATRVVPDFSTGLAVITELEEADIPLAAAP